MANSLLIAVAGVQHGHIVGMVSALERAEVCGDNTDGERPRIGISLSPAQSNPITP
jgi:hypothetical protein